MDIAELGRGTDTSTPPPGGAPGHSMNGNAGSPRGGDPLLAGVRRLTLLADSADGAEEIFRTLARELMGTPGADEVHVHHLGENGGGRERTVIYLFEGEGRLSYLTPREERPPGVAWVASTGRGFLATDVELAASVPRLTLVSVDPGPAGSALLVPLAVRGEVEAVVLLVRRGSVDPFTDRSTELASHARRPGRDRAGAAARPRRGRHRHRHGLHEPPRYAPPAARGGRPRRARSAARCRRC